MRKPVLPDIESPIELGEAWTAAPTVEAADVTAIPGLKELWSQTLGDPAVCVAILDGPADLSHPSLAAADLTQLDFGNNILHSSLPLSDHGTHVTSIIFGRHDGQVKGIAPRCRGLIIPIFRYGSDGSLLPCKQEDLAEAILLAARYGASVINISGGQFSPGGQASEKLTCAVASVANQALIVAAAGNDGCECLHVPGALPSVLAVGAMSADGEPLSFSNWGDKYRDSGVLAIGEGILGAGADGGVATYSGTSFATPIVSGIAALLLSLSRRSGQCAAPRRIREVILQGAVGCDVQRTDNCDRLLAGRLSIGGSVQQLQRGDVNVNDTTPIGQQPSEATTSQANITHAAASVSAPGAPQSMLAAGDGVPQTGPVQEVVPSKCGCDCGAGSRRNAYVIGRLGYDFESFAREDSINHALEPVVAAPNDPQVTNPVDFLRHVRGFQEIKVDAAIGGIQNIRKHGTGVIEVTTRRGDPRLTSDDDWRAIAISQLLVSYDGGTTFEPSLLNASAKVIVPKIDVLGPNMFLLLDCEHNDFVYRWDDANWYLPRGCEAKQEQEHDPHPHDASATTWTLIRGATVLYGLSPSGPYSEEAFEELSDFLLSHLGLTQKGLNFYYLELNGEIIPWWAIWDPCFNAEFSRAQRQNLQPKSLTAPKSERIAVPGAITGQVRLKNGTVIQTIDPDMRGTAEWSREALLERIERNLYPGLNQDNDLKAKIADLLDRLDEDVRNSGLAAEERALNFASTQHYELLARVLGDLRGPFEVDTVLPPTRSQHCREGSDCWDVEVSFFDPSNITAAPIIVRQSVDVSDVVPCHIDETRRFRRR